MPVLATFCVQNNRPADVTPNAIVGRASPLMAGNSEDDFTLGFHAPIRVLPSLCDLRISQMV